MRHFTKVIPTIAASIQAAAAFADEDILFDWHKVEGFKGSEVNGITAIIRGTNGADQTMVDFELLFATSGIRVDTGGVGVDVAPPSLGTVNAGVSTYQWKNNLTGHFLFDVDVTGRIFNDGDLDVLNIATTSGLNIPVGQDLYIAAIVKGDWF